MNKRIAILVTGLVLVIGGVGAVVVAQQFTQESDIVGAIEVPLGARITSDLADLATVTELEAVAAAQASLETSDAPTEAELEIENGFLVWEVEFPGWEVVVDAGTFEGADAPQVLLIEEESDDDDDDDEDEGIEDDAN